MQIIGNRYQIEQELGAGGMGTVYRGLDKQSGDSVAIKKLKPQLSNPDLIERFKREGEALRALKHPNIVQLLDAVEEDGEDFLIMEYVTGGDLSQKLEKGALPLKELLRLAIDLCDALTRAHKLDIIHRDLKPANILIAEDGTVRLTDFGVALFGSKQRMTTVDSIIGTIDYLAPENFETGLVDKRADIWAVGVILFEMLTGQRPFSKASVNQTLSQIISGAIPDIEELCPQAPPALVDLIYRILTRNPDERIPSIRLVGAELEALLHDNPLTPPPTSALPSTGISITFQTTPVPATKHNLPRPGTPFVGREHELSAVVSLLRDPKVQLVTIIAQGGMGKTRLSIEAAKSLLEQYPQGVYFVELAPLSTAEDIPSAIAEALGYPFHRGSSPQEQISRYFADKNCLLVLDNFEHLTEGRDLVQAILQVSPTKIIVTSRERLNLSSETLYHLEGMDFPHWETPADALKYAAMRLFLESAKRVQADFTLQAADLPHAARICRLVNGLPLGIVLAASWLDALSLKEIGEEIASNIDFLETTMHDVPERQRSLRAVFDYSWKMLSDDEQQAFARLSVFRGGMSREAAQAVSETNLRSLQMLVNKSLLRRDNATGRYEIHELLRQYAEEFLRQEGHFEEIRARHATYYSQFTARHGADLKGKRQLAALAEFDVDFENIKVSWRYACHKKDADTLHGMLEPVYWYCTFRNRNMEGYELFHMARELWNDNSLLAGRLLLGFPVEMNDYTAYYERSLEIVKPYNAQLEIAFATHRLGHWLSHSLDNNARGVPLMEESVAIYEKIGEPFYLGVVLDDLGWSYRSSGQLMQQQDVVQRSIDIRREIGDKIGMANALRNLGGALGGMGAGVVEPLYKWLEALQLSKEIGDKRNIAWNAYMVSIYWQYDGELEKARPYRQEAFEIASEIREDIVYRLCLLSEAFEIILTGGDYARAKSLLAEGYPPNSPNDFRSIIHFTAQTFLAAIEEDYVNIRKVALSMYQLGKDRGHPIIASTILLGIQVLMRDAQFELAAEWLGTTEQSPLNRITRNWPWYQDFRAALVAKIEKHVFEAAYERGSKRPMLEAAAIANAYLEKQS
jgi:predicted ATPase/predicted Ser/Thr protein kinase